MENGGRIIFQEPSEERLPEFRELMDRVVRLLSQRASEEPMYYKSLNGTMLEKIVCDAMKELAVGTCFDPDSIQLRSGQSFPDIIVVYSQSANSIKYYGVEVKTTKENKWTSTGSSIVESSRIDGVERIFLLFGKLGDPIEFKCRPYEHCLSGIAVTHSPRYLIDMALDERETIIKKMEADYDTFRNSPDNVRQVRRYYQEKAKAERKSQMPWWLDNTSDVNLMFWGDRSLKSRKKELTAYMLILFPGVLSGDYGMAALWLCTRYYIVNPNFRDTFSASGATWEIDKVRLPKSFKHVIKVVLENVDLIDRILRCPEDILQEDILEYWEKVDTEKPLFDQWVDRTEQAFLEDKELRVVPIREYIRKRSKVTSTTAPKK